MDTAAMAILFKAQLQHLIEDGMQGRIASSKAAPPHSSGRPTTSRAAWQAATRRQGQVISSKIRISRMRSSTWGSREIGSSNRWIDKRDRSKCLIFRALI